MARNTQLVEARRRIDELDIELRRKDKLIKSLEEDLATERKRSFQALNVAEHSSTAISAMATTLTRLNRSLDEVMCKMVHQS